MKRESIKILIVVMSLSIVAMVIVQIYWLNQAFAASENEFNGRVYNALDETVKAVNEYEVNQYYAKFSQVRTSLKDTVHKPQVITSQIEQDSGNVKYVLLTRYMVDKIALPLSNSYSDSLNVTELYAAEQELMIKKDSTVKGFKPLEINLDDEFSNANYTIERFAKFDAGNKPISKRISIPFLDSVFHHYLVKWNVKTAFELGVLGKDSVRVLLKSKNFYQTAQNISEPLFYDKEDQAAYYLSVVLPQRQETILSKISALFFVTILLTLIILGIYITSIYLMMRQRKISQMKTAFMNNMTHEFKTPLATIGVATDALKAPLIAESPEKVKHYANLIKQENKKMNHQVELVLRMSKLERNEMKLDKQKVGMNDIVRESVESISLIVENRNGTIFEKYNAELDEMRADPFHMGNVVLNILDNANKYSPETPKINVETYTENSWYVVEITDKGIGMSKTVLDKIFDEFYREETGNIHNVKGHGLGLSYVKRIVEMHNGIVEVNSELGKGSSFKLKLPIK